MSYCRWSTDDFQCDLYIYADVRGGFTTHVAGYRPVHREPLPEPVDFHADTLGWFARHQKVMKMMDAAEREPIGLPHDGETFNDETLDGLLTRILALREVGYRFPDYVLDDIRAEIVEANAASDGGEGEKP